MWQSIISIDIKYKNEIDLIKERLESLPEIYFAQEVSSSRCFFNIAGNESLLAITECKLYAIIADLIGINMKSKFFIDLVKYQNLTMPVVALISALVYYDHEKEYDYINKNLEDIYEYSIDGLLNFKFKSLLEDWTEMGEMLTNLIASNPKDSDVWSVVVYLLGGRKKNETIFLADNKLPLLSIVKSKKILRIRKIFDDNSFNIINEIIGFNPQEIYVDSQHCDKFLWEELKNIYSIKLL